jgi:hypothetical protein
MVKKKLLTLAGVLAILASGACLLPPLPRHKPPPPPVLNGLDGVSRIRVEVVNSSPSHHLEPVALAQKVAEAINQQTAKTKINAHAAIASEGGDAVLLITVLSETVESTAAARARSVTLYIKDSATLKRLDDALAWQETEVGNPITGDIGDEKVPDVWKSPGLVDRVSQALSDRLAFRMLYRH